MFADIPLSNTEAEPRQVQQAEPPAQNVAPTPTNESTGEMFEEMDTSGPGDESQLAPPPSASGSFVQSQVDLSKVDVEATTVPNGEGAPTTTESIPKAGLASHGGRCVSRRIKTNEGLEPRAVLCAGVSRLLTVRLSPFAP